ncbi:MAG: hypothetical protein R2813_05175 [Flavobacteriales bacterium]
MTTIRKTIFVLFSFHAIWSYGQTGPGGVGNSTTNGLWLRADILNQNNNTSVPTWPDASGNGNDAVQATSGLQPIHFFNGSLNSQSIVRFDGSNDEMAVADTDILDSSAGITFYVVIRPTNLNGAARGILGKRISFSTPSEYAYTWFFYTGNNLFLDVHTNDNRFNTTTTFSNSTNYLLSWTFDGTQPSTRRVRIRSGSTIIRTSTETSTFLPNSNQVLAIGALNAGYGTYLGADYGEIIHFNHALDTVQHILVQNYLSAKYNIALASNNLYDEDEPSNGNFDFNVAGIGRTDASNIVDDAQGSGLVRILNPTDLGNDEFMIWGDNGDSAQAIDSSDIPITMAARFQRVWRVSEVNGSLTAVDVGNVDMRWDLSGLGPVTASDLRLLIDTDNDAVFNDETPISGATAIGGGVYQFSGVSALANNRRFTIGTINLSQTPLPVELVAFTANCDGHNQVVVSWTTASETNCDYYTIERSHDGETWNHLSTRNGSGTTKETTSYHFIDSEPLVGQSYYRLRQTDTDGKEWVSNPVTIDKNAESTLKLYPNPSSVEIIISGDIRLLNEFQITDTQGKDCTDRVLLTHSTDHQMMLNIGELENGVYHLHSEQASLRFLKN